MDLQEISKDLDEKIVFPNNLLFGLHTKFDQIERLPIFQLSLNDFEHSSQGLRCNFIQQI